MSEAMNIFDTINFKQNHPLYSTKNHRILSNMKNETGSIPPREFVGFWAKCIIYRVDTNHNKKIKGIKKYYVKKTCPSQKISFHFHLFYLQS